MKKLSFFLMAMLFSVMSNAAEVTEVVTMKGFAGSSSSTYENVTKTGASDKGTTMVAYAFNPSTGQIRGGKTAIAGASVTTADNGKNWSLYNVDAMAGAIKSIKVTHTSASGNYFRNNLYVALGTTNQGAVTTVSSAQKNTSISNEEITFDIDPAQGYTYFKLLSNEKFTSGTVVGAVVTIIYEAADNPDAVKYTITANVNDPTMGSVSGAGEYEEGKTATLTANANAGYRFINWSNGSTDNPLKITVTEDVEVTANFEAIPPMTCAEAAAAPEGASIVLNPFDVVAVVKGAGYIYIKDESGVALIFDFNLDDQLKAGDHVEGFVGVSSPYKGLPELKPSVAFADLTVTPGTAPEPTVFTEAPVKADVNKYVKFEGVSLSANVSFTTSSATNATMVVNGTNVTLRNNFKLAATLSKDKTYDIVGFVAIFNSDIQVYFLSATEIVPPVVNYTVTVTAENGTVEGAGEYEEGATATLTATAASGYKFVNWTSGETVVSTENPYKFTVTADVALVANFKEAEPESEWNEMSLEITNLTTEVKEVEGAKFLLLMGRDDMNDADVTLVLNNYADVDDDYEVNAESSYMTFGGLELTVLEGTMTQTSETAKGTIYEGTVRATVTDEELGGTMYVEFALTMYATPATVLVLTDAIVAINEELGTLTFNVPTGEGEGYFVELSGYTAPGVHEGPQICVFETPEVVAYTNYAVTSVADGVITLKGEFTSPMGPKFNLTISGTLPNSTPDDGDVTFDFTTKEGLEALGIAYPTTDAGNGAYSTDLEEGKAYSQSGISLTAKYGSTATRIWLAASGKLDLRHYKGGVLTFAAPAGKVITNIVFDGADVSGLTPLVDNAWNGLAAVVEIPAASDAKTIKINTIKVHVADASSDYVATPVISGEADFMDNTTVTITAEEGLEVYYTLDGTDPTKASIKYTAPFELTATTTVKAIAYNGDKASAVVEKKFTKMTILTCAEAVALCTNPATPGQHIIRGYITEMIEAYNDQYKNITFWMADTPDGGQVLQAFRVRPVSDVEQALKVGDFVEVIGSLILYTKDGVSIPEVNAGGSVKLITAGNTAVDNVTVDQQTTKFIENGQLIIVKNGVRYNALGQVTK